MTENIDASKLSLNDVHRFLKLEECLDGYFQDLLFLEPLTEIEHQDILRIKNDFNRYMTAGKVSEGLVKFLTIAPLMRLTGFYDAPIKMTMENSIPISVEDEDIIVTGRLDILAINTIDSPSASPLWILVIEAKNSTFDVSLGLPQLLNYTFKSLENQSSVWGMVTNGLRYQFVYLKRGNPLTYQLMPLLSLNESEGAIKLIQIMKAICKLQSVQLQLA